MNKQLVKISKESRSDIFYILYLGW